jgi:hypothetical protein
VRRVAAPPTASSRTAVPARPVSRLRVVSTSSGSRPGAGRVAVITRSWLRADAATSSGFAASPERTVASADRSAARIPHDGGDFVPPGEGFGDDPASTVDPAAAFRARDWISVRRAGSGAIGRMMR